MTIRLQENYDTDPTIALTRALQLMATPRHRAYVRNDHATYDAWIWAETAVQQKREWYRERNARQSAPWFEHQPTQPTDDQGDQ